MLCLLCLRLLVRIQLFDFVSLHVLVSFVVDVWLVLFVCVCLFSFALYAFVCGSGVLGVFVV